MWWRLDSKIESTGKTLDGKIEDVRLSLDGKIENTGKELDGKIEGVRLASEAAHQSIRDDLYDLKVTTATIKTDVEWLKNDRQQ